MEAYVNGVSTRKVDRLVEQLGIGSMSEDRVSRLCKALDEQVALFRERPLEDPFPYLWLDAKQLKVRDRGHVYSKALVIAYGVHKSGRREVIGLDIGEVESGAFWVEFLRELRARGLHGVKPCVSDADEGLKATIARVLGCPWQAKERATVVIERLAPAVPKVAELLEEAEEDLIAFYRFPAAHWSKLRSTNPLERVNREAGRRSDVVGILPNDDSAIRLAVSLLVEQNDEWLISRRYLSEESLALVLEDQGDEEREEVPQLQAA